MKQHITAEPQVKVTHSKTPICPQILTAHVDANYLLVWQIAPWRMHKLSSQEGFIKTVTDRKGTGTEMSAMHIQN